MVLYINDINLYRFGHKFADLFLFILPIIIIIQPILIYFRRYSIAFGNALILSLLQIWAIRNNIMKYPL